MFGRWAVVLLLSDFYICVEVAASEEGGGGERSTMLRIANWYGTQAVSAVVSRCQKLQKKCTKRIYVDGHPTYQALFVVARTCTNLY